MTRPIYSIYVAHRIRLDETERLAKEYILAVKKRNLLHFEVVAGQHLFIYSFGVMVFIGIDQRFYKKIIEKFASSFIEPTKREISEDYAIGEATEKDTVEQTQVRLKEYTHDRISIVAEVLAQSTAIEYFDLKTDEIVASFEKINSELEKRGELHIKTKEIVKIIGAAHAILQSLITRLSLLDQPDIVWDNAELENLYKNMRSFYELDSRFKNIGFKIDYIKSTSETILSLLQHRRSVSLELIVIFLIAIEIIIFLGEWLVKKFSGLLG
jgi:uncharacterized Rmd1/YagE family protein